MEEKLYRKLKSDCRFILICMTILVCIFIAWFLGSLLTYLDIMKFFEMKEETKLKELLEPVVLLLGAMTVGSVTLLPYGKDLRLIRKHEYRIIEATFLRYDYQNINGKTSKMRAVPLFCDTLTKEILTFPLDEELEQGVCYRIGYLPNTKTAVIDMQET